MIQMPENKRNVPPVLTCLDGTDVSDSRIWYEKRRPEILELFRSQEYGRLPDMKWKWRPSGEENISVLTLSCSSRWDKAGRYRHS